MSPYLLFVRHHMRERALSVAEGFEVKPNCTRDMSGLELLLLWRARGAVEDVVSGQISFDLVDLDCSCD